MKRKTCIAFIWIALICFFGSMIAACVDSDRRGIVLGLAGAIAMSLSILLNNDRKVTAAIEAAEYFHQAAAGKIPCGHTVGDLIWAPGMICRCARCVAQKHGRETAIADRKSPIGEEGNLS